MKVTYSNEAIGTPFASLKIGAIVRSVATQTWYVVVKNHDFQGLVRLNNHSYNGYNFVEKDQADGTVYMVLSPGESITITNDEEVK